MKIVNNTRKKIDMTHVCDLLKYRQKVEVAIDEAVNGIVKNGCIESNLFEELNLKLSNLENLFINEKPYINGEYNPDYGDDRICECGHTYDRHFDSYEDMEPVGCKYCTCHEFKEVKKNSLKWSDLSNEAKKVLEWSENLITKKHDLMDIEIGEYFDRNSITYDKDTFITHILITEDLFYEIKKWCVIG